MSRLIFLAFVLLAPGAARSSGGALVFTLATCSLKRGDGSSFERPLNAYECDYLRGLRGPQDSRAAVPLKHEQLISLLARANEEHTGYLARVKELIAGSDPALLPPGVPVKERLRFLRAQRPQLFVDAVQAAEPFLFPSPGSAEGREAAPNAYPESWRRYIEPAFAHMREIDVQTVAAEKIVVDAAAAKRRTLPRMTGAEPGFDLGGLDPNLVTPGANPRAAAGGRPAPVISAANLKGPATRVIVLPPSSYRTTSATSWGSAVAEAASAKYHGLLAALGLDAPRAAPPLPRAGAASLPRPTGKTCWFCNMPAGPALLQIPATAAGRAKRNYFSRGVEEGAARLDDDFKIATWHAWRTTKTIGDPYGLARLIIQQVGGTCAIESQYEALRAAGKPADPKRLVEEAVRLHVYKPELGTMPDKMNALLNAHGLKNKLILNASIADLDAAVKADGRAIISVDVRAFWGVPYGGGHAVFITGAELEEGGRIRGYYFNDTGGGEGARFVSAAVLKRAFTGTVVALPRS
jgi:hypothetical protein